MAASNEQVQQFVNEHVRPDCEHFRATVLRMDDSRAVIDDVYDNLNNSPDWTDTRPDAPPHLLTPADVLAYNGFCEDVRTYMKAHSAYPVILKGCVRAINV